MPRFKEVRRAFLKMKSPLSAQARRPENDVMICRLGTFFTLIPAFSKTNARPLCVVAVSSRSSIFSAVGPSSRLPVHGGGDKNALAEFCRQLEDGFINQIARVFVAQAVFAAARGDGERVRQQHIVNFIGVHTRPR